LEKRKPSHDLEAFKRVCGNPATLDMTSSALRSARELGLEVDDVVQVIQSMNRRMFYKSMTSYDDHTKWQDVYHVPVGDRLTIYLKFMSNVLTEFTILSFKEK
jgi:motility quorum-sensing regulator/GCU-specific mRNA interferase toxin